jgi:hypothetical protein
MTERFPDWPFGMPADMAALYLGIPKAQFLREVREGKMPPPNMHGRRLVWLRPLLEAAEMKKHSDGASIANDDAPRLKDIEW